jgi:hypothetical protein
MKFNVNGKEYESKKINVFVLTDKMCDWMRERLMADAAAFAKHLEGTDKSKFLLDAYRNLPGKDKLLEMAESQIKSFDGIQWLLEQSCGEKIAIDTNIDDYIPIVEYAMGIEPESEKREDSKEDPLTEEKPSQA